MPRGKKLASIMLALLLLPGLTACGGREAEKGPDRYGGIRYIPAFRELDGEIESIRSGCVMGECVYLTGSVTTNEDYRDLEARLLRIPLDGGEIEALPGCEPPSGDRNIILSTEGLAVAAGEEGTLWALESAWRYVYDFPEDFDPYDLSAGIRGEYYVGSEGKYVLRQLDGDGGELYRKEWPRKELEERLGLDYIGGCEIFLSEEGGAAFCSRSIGAEALVTMDRTGALQGRVAKEDANQNWQGAVRLGDGRMAVWGSYQEGETYGTWLRAVSRTGDAWEEIWTIPDFANIYNGDGNALFYYNAGNDLMAWRERTEAREDEETEEDTPLLSWVNTGLDSGGDRWVTQFLPDGRLAVVQGGGVWSGDAPAELAVLTPRDGPPEKTVLTLGTAQLFGDLEDAVRKFNRTNQDYCIEVWEYTDYTAGEGWQDGIDRLAAEVGAGRIPDILDMYGMPLYAWAAGGILEDLWPWIDLDRDVDREDLMIRALEADSIGGKLCEIPSGFSFATAVGLEKVVGGRLAWTPEEMWAALEDMPEGSLALPDSREDLLRAMLRMFWSRLVDLEGGTCHFDSEEFRELLAFCGQFPEKGVSWDEQDAMLQDGELMLAVRCPGRFLDIQQMKTEFRGEVSFVGLPNPWGKVGSAFNVSGGLAMASGGGHKEGAWAFLRNMLLPQRQSVSPFLRTFPLNREAFEAMAQEDGKGYGYSVGGESRSYRKPSREEYDQIVALYEAADHVYRWDERLGETLLEIAGAYFAGDKTLDEAAALIQNRAQLYVNEQK